MYCCLIKSLSKGAIKYITIWNEDYMSGRNTSGNALLKVIIRRSGLDKKSTVSHIMTQLSFLPEYIKMVADNIPKFNNRIKSLITSLNE